MILDFACKDTEKVWEGVKTKKWSGSLVKIALRKLFMLNAAHHLNDLRIPPSNRLHPLRNELKDYYSISINMQWRITFKWEGGNVTRVSIVDYH